MQDLYELPLNLLHPLGEYSPEELRRPRDTFAQVEAVKTSLRSIGRRMIGRDRLLEQTLLALLTRRNQLIFSPPGTGKTLYTQLVFHQFEDAEVFTIQLTAGTPEEALVGAIDIDKLQQGIVWHDTSGSLVTADFAFLDELMDANDLVLRSALGVLNERAFAKGKQLQKAKLHTAIAATNYLRRSQMTQAVLDRFIFKAWLAPQTSALDQLRTDAAYGQYGSRVERLDPPLSVELIGALSRLVRGENHDHMFMPSSVLFLKNQLIKDYVRRVNAVRSEQSANYDEYYISPRTIAESRDILNASAVLNHRLDVRAEDLVALSYVLPIVSVGIGVGPGVDIAKENRIFFETLASISSAYSAYDLQIVEEVMDISRFYDEFASGRIIETAKESGLIEFFRRGLRLIGLLSWEEASSDTFIHTLQNMNITHRDVDELREALIARILNDGHTRSRQ